jgi:hypothetical protein
MWVIKSIRKRWAGHMARMESRIVVGRPDRKRTVWRPRLRGEDNIKICLKEVGWEAWTGLIWLRIGTGGSLL